MRPNYFDDRNGQIETKLYNQYCEKKLKKKSNYDKTQKLEFLQNFKECFGKATDEMYSGQHFIILEYFFWYHIYSFSIVK